MRICTITVSLATALLFCACSGPTDRKEYKLQGQILSVAADHKEANIKHEDIKGLMPAMTMPYKVRDAKQFEGIAPGDLINATLVVVSNDAYLQDVKKVGNAPLAQPAAQAAAPSASSGFELLKEGEPVPNVSFVNQDGTHLEFDSFKGDAVVVTFIYTKCPMPNFCPLMDQQFAKIQQKLKEKNNELKVHLLSVSFDPLEDTPPVLKKHAQRLGADPRVWTFVTGDRDDIDRWASRFGVSVSRALDDPTNITHNLRTAIVDRQGNLVQTYTGNQWTPEQVVSDVKVMVGVD
ncbi:MAG TPA: SCO family protein [Vicinamibacterales bacterium]|jgi:protein SCO1/2